MIVFHDVEALRSSQFQAHAACLGNFDGVHLGHQALFAKATAPVLAFTFHPHPGKVLQPQLAPKLICTQARKLELLQGTGIAAVLCHPFHFEFAQTTAAAFEALLFDALALKQIVVGQDFTYGRKRSGTVETLKAAATQRGAQVDAIAPVTLNGVVVSSSRIRELILEGRVEAAAQLLGRPFDFDGLVVSGAGRGKSIGFPTANVDTVNELKPAAGVYAVRVQHEGVWHAGAANIGVKPTFGLNQVTVEVHVLDFSRDLYGKSLRVQFLAFLRGEQRFGSVAELTAQIARDVEASRAVVARHPLPM